MVTLALLREANSLREEKLISKMIDAHGQGGQAVLGLDETLQAVSDKRVQTLIISDGYRTHGYFQPESGYVVANLTKSPLSDRELTETEDVIEEAVAQTMAQGGHVEIVTDNPALEQAGRIGAILRY
jgi:peptide chain release factor subunit 1